MKCFGIMLSCLLLACITNKKVEVSIPGVEIVFLSENFDFAKYHDCGRHQRHKILLPDFSRKEYPRGQREGNALDILRPGLKRITIRSYRKEAQRMSDGTVVKGTFWRTPEQVRGYLVRILSAEPEGGVINTYPAWSEGMWPSVIASLEFTNGAIRELHLGNGYLYFEDSSARPYWARYLGADKSRWVTAEN